MNNSVPLIEAKPRSVNLLSMLSQGINRAATVISIGLMVAMVLDIAMQVIFRYLLNHSLAWSEELGRYLFLWTVFLGSTIGIKKNLHPSFGAVVNKLPVRIRANVIVIGQALVAAFCVILLLLSDSLIPSIYSTLTPALQVPISYFYLIFPVFSIISLVHIAANMLESRKGTSLFGWIIALAAFAVTVYATTIEIPLQFDFSFILLVSLVILFSLGLPIAFVLGLTSVFLFLFTSSIPMTVIVQRMFLVSDNFSLMAIPFFMLTGAIMQVGGVAERLVRLASVLVGWVRGGLGYADILVSAFFADISGSAVADTAAIGSVMLPGMVKKGYDKPFATAIQSAAGTLGVLIPPGITMIIFAITANVSVTKMFLASLLPALIVMLSFALIIFITAKKRDLPREPRPTGKEVLSAFKGAFFPLWTPVIILGGILSGIFTTTEAGVIAVFYTIIISVFQRKLSLKSLYHAFVDAINSTSRVMLIVASAFILGWLLVVSQLSQNIAHFLFSLSDNPYIILIIINIFLALVHVVLETNSTILLIVPILLPILGNIGVDPIHFGILILINSAIGLLTPPIGIILYIASGITNIRVEALAKAVVPFILILVADLILIIVFPDIVSFLPNMFGK
ncbi:TRAP transporter large permease subunit [Aneurinibacillus sp. Ricciae_BoGa-3]|uniref:TRAP transporter large permease n=1 Tax=Aneurinibacillus sp. Ricciae_BoGa-3 TaxID=3022697 RepID=UPI0023413615|nr:TRAP transporter large permease subunit [Aneurinibacillus sp. Ricciae_BoGa-3]WCK56410.1 TRAP transporter large permease subunit [Aneurinibacillus sp. Ricciae_BoGa-3]